MQTLLDEHKIDEAKYMKKLKVYKELLLILFMNPPFVTPKDNFAKLNKEQYQVGFSGEPLKIQFEAPKEMKGACGLEISLLSKMKYN
jgi:hypothetical protein